MEESLCAYSHESFCPIVKDAEGRSPEVRVVKTRDQKRKNAGGEPDYTSLDSGGRVVCFAKVYTGGIFVSLFNGFNMGRRQPNCL